MRRPTAVKLLGPTCVKCRDPLIVAPIPCGLGYQCVGCFSRPFRLIRAAVRIERGGKGEAAC